MKTLSPLSVDPAFALAFRTLLTTTHVCLQPTLRLTHSSASVGHPEPRAGKQ
jgi:hypothetical protein